MRIVTRAPYRIEFAGGGTDIPEYYNSRLGFVFSAAIKKYVTCTLITRDDEQVTSNFPYIKECADYYNITGVDIQLEYDIPHGSGLGGSSSSFVAICFAMTIYKTKSNRMRNYYSMNKRKIFMDAIHLERSVCKMPGGIQDQILSAVGGFVCISMYENQIYADSIWPSVQVIRDLEDKLVLVKVEGSRDGGKSIENLVSHYSEKKSMEALEELKLLAHRMPLYLIENRLNDFYASIMRAHNLKTSAYSATNSAMDEITDTLRNSGYRYRLEGAGNGGHILVVVDIEYDVTKGKFPFKGMPVEFDYSGVKCIDYNS